jgi:hypothetical protein
MIEGVNSSVICLIYFKNFYKSHNVPPPSPTIKIIINKECGENVHVSQSEIKTLNLFLWKNSTPLGKMKYTRVYEILDSNYIF